MRVYTPRHRPEETVGGHLTFALRYEGLDLAVLKALFRATGPESITDIVRAAPTGAYARRLRFLYEWLLQERLDLPDATQGAYAPVVDPEQQSAISGTTLTRHRVKNNLPGTPAFCPMVFRTPALDAFVARDLAAAVRRAVAEVPSDLLARTAAFLLLKDSRASFQIEGEDPPQDRVQRWGQAIGEAGWCPIDLDELLRLQRIVIGDARFVHMGLRREGGFVGEHDRVTGLPIPDHVSARHQDLPDLVDGLIAFGRNVAPALDPVLAAAMLAFGFVYVHPFEDGNGRLHRYLIHDVLAHGGFNPAGMVFPVSAVTLDRIDATPHAEFLFSCVARMIDVDLPAETAFLRGYDEFRRRVSAMVDMPDRVTDLLFRFLRQNAGRLLKRAREREFEKMTDAEVAEVETIYAGVRLEFTKDA